MKLYFKEIIESMPISLANDFRIGAASLMLDLIEEMEMRFNTLTEDEINFFRVLQSIQSDQVRFKGMCLAFGNLMYANQVLDDLYETSLFQSSQQNQDNPDGNDIPRELQ